MSKLSNFVTRRWTTKKGVTKECYYYGMPRSVNRKLVSLGSDYSAALKKYAGIVGADSEKSKPNTVAAVYDDYIKWANNREISGLAIRTISDRVNYWRHLNLVFGECAIDTLQSSWLLEYFELRSSQDSAKKELKFLSVMCNWAKARGKMNGINPCTGIMQQLKVSEGREIYVEDSWYVFVHNYGSQAVKDVMEFTLLFANRPAETRTAQFPHIEGDELVIELQKTKGKGLKEKRVPLDGFRLKFINKQKAKTPRSFFIVSDDAGQRVRINSSKFKMEWKEARDKAEAFCKKRDVPFTRFQLRDLRAKAATDIARDFGIEAARLMLGHTTQKQTSAYIRSVKGAAKVALKVASGESDL